MKFPQNFLARLAASPLVKRFEQEDEAALDATRRTHGEAILAAHRERDAKLPALDAAQDKAFAAIKAARDKLATAEQAYHAATAARSSVLNSIEHRVAAHEAFLRQHPRAEIVSAREAVASLLDQLRSTQYTADFRRGWTRAGAPRDVLIASNHAAVGRRLEAAVAADRALDRLAEAYVADVPAAVASILATIPNGFDAVTPAEPTPDAATFNDLEHTAPGTNARPLMAVG